MKSIYGTMMLLALTLMLFQGTTLAEGNFRLTFPVHGTSLAATPDTTYLEDYNGDRTIDMRDAVWLARKMNASPGDMTCDYNRDGKAGVTDVLSLLISIRDGKRTPIITTGTYPMMGRIVEGQIGITGVRVTIHGTGVDTVILTNAIGMYMLEDLENGNYTVLPARSNYFFQPDSITVRVQGDSLFCPDIEAVYSGYALIGYLRDTDSSGLAAASVRITGGVVDTTIISDGAGKYRVSGLQAGVYVIRPTKEYYEFAPDSLVATLTAGQSLIVKDMIGTFNNPQQTELHTISGKIFCSSGGIANVRIILKSATVEKFTLTDINGFYSFLVQSGPYTIVPFPSIGYAFNPISQDLYINQADQTNVNFFMYGAESVP